MEEMSNEKKLEKKKEQSGNISEELLKKVELEAREIVKEYMEEEMLGYKYYLYQEMKELFKEMGIEWEIPCSDPPTMIVD